MKVAIMTQPLGSNYGGIMQAWALQQVLKRMGHEPVTIDRQPDQAGMVYKATRYAYRASMKALGKRKAPINIEKHLPRIFQNTKSFINQNIKMSDSLYSTPQLRDHFDREKYEAVIVGSDQTWRPKYSPNIGNYFLDFLADSRIRKLAYATSFGVDEWEFSEKQTRYCASLINKFSAISVRESSAVELCHSNFQCQAEQVLDPTLLLTANEYIELLDLSTSKVQHNKLFVYFLDPEKNKEIIMDRVATQLNIRPYMHQPNISIHQLSSKNIEDYIYPEVESWVSAFQDAEYVLTDSFHGCVFSIIFNKPFFVINNEERGAARLQSLLALFNLESRSSSVQKFSDEILLSPINWHHVNAAILELRLKSMSFLDKHLALP